MRADAIFESAAAWLILTGGGAPSRLLAKFSSAAARRRTPAFPVDFCWASKCLWPAKVYGQQMSMGQQKRTAKPTPVVVPTGKMCLRRFITQNEEGTNSNL